MKDAIMRILKKKSNLEASEGKERYSTGIVMFRALGSQDVIIGKTIRLLYKIDKSIIQ